jgi:hypothetical protein
VLSISSNKPLDDPSWMIYRKYLCVVGDLSPFGSIGAYTLLGRWHYDMISKVSKVISK